MGIVINKASEEDSLPELLDQLGVDGQHGLSAGVGLRQTVQDPGIAGEHVAVHVAYAGAACGVNQVQQQAGAKATALPGVRHHQRKFATLIVFQQRVAGDAALGAHPGQGLAPAHAAGDLLDQQGPDGVGVADGTGGHIGDQRRLGLADHGAGQRLGHFLGGGPHERAVKGRGDIERDGAGAQGLGRLDRALDPGLVAGDDHIAGVVVVGDHADAHLGALGRGLFGQGEVDLWPDQRGHGARAERRGALHGLAPQPEQARGVRQAERLGGRQGGIFSERMAGDEGGAGLAGGPVGEGVEVGEVAAAPVAGGAEAVEADGDAGEGPRQAGRRPNHRPRPRNRPRHRWP